MTRNSLPYENRALFSDYYLAERLADHPQWNEDISDAFEATRGLYLPKREILDGMNEAQTEDEFIRPMLREILGFAVEVQAPATLQGKLNRPDYTLFLDKEEKAKAQAVKEDEGLYFARAVAVADAKFWGRPLDKRIDDPREELTNANPSFQIVNYLVATGVDWGMLTNGRLWRLYYARARSRIDTYFEVDLAAALENGDVEAFRVFYQFFRAAAFRPDPETNRSFLEAVYDGSATYGAELQDRLKELIFEEIFLDIATGFLAQRNQEGDFASETQESLDEVFEGTLRLLYRLLFLLHAEARGLLPIDEQQGYYQYSLTRLKLDVAARIDRGRTLSRVSTDIWDDLKGLFRIIDRGEPGLNVPRYNGGLFRQDEPRNTFLEQEQIADHFLAPALDRLTRELDPESGQRRFIDYKSLNVEQLGSIYEGLLEFRLHVADEDLAVVRERGREVYQPASEVNDPLGVIGAGQPYLENNRGERRATGSYYTPHYIVEYIVENTLGPVLDQRAERFRVLMAEIEPRRERLLEVEAKSADQHDRRDAAATRWKNEAIGLRRELENLEHRAREVLLGLRVCDPAMGSGHFLVHTVDWLAERLIALLNEYPENPLLGQLSQTRERIVDELGQQGVRIDVDRLKDTNLLKRTVMKRCIYGVDINPMATELAKLSLWLDSFTVGAPLSFLDHHLKTGNSLIGTTVDEVREAMEGKAVSDEAQQMYLFSGPFAGLLQATSLMRDVATRADATFADVEASADQYAAFEDAMAPYKRVLDLWVARHFGLEGVDAFLRDHGLELLKRDGQPGVHDSETYQTATRLAAEQHFFHWELEFPEVFVDLAKAEWKADPGFDTLFGNPPYISVTNIPSDHRTYYLSEYETATGRFDVYLIFQERSLCFLSQESYMSFIIPIKWAIYANGRPLRNILLDDVTLHSLVDISQCQVFSDPTVYPCIAVVENTPPSASHTVAVIRPPSADPEAVLLDPVDLRSHAWLEGIPIARFKEAPERVMSPLLNDVNWSLFSKAKKWSAELGDRYRIEQCIRIGSSSGREDLLLESGVRPDNPDYHPVIDGENLRRYQILWDGSFILYDREALYNPKSPDLLDRPKLLMKRISDRLTCAYDQGSEYGFYYPLNTIYGLYEISEDQHQRLLHLTFLNSKLLDWIYKLLFAPIGIRGGYIEYREYLKYLPLLSDVGKSVSNASGLQPYLDEASHILDWEPGASIATGEKTQALVEKLGGAMVDYYATLSSVLGAYQPLKYFSSQSRVEKLGDIFRQEIKYADPGIGPEPDVSIMENHDPDGIRLVPHEPGYWGIDVLLKIRDRAGDWKSWQYEEDGRSIKRRWVSAYRFEMDEKKARYYEFAFEVLDQFENFTSFPGGYTRSARQKLLATKIPEYEPDVDLTPLVELRQELEEVDEKIERTDTLIDQIVYKLYGLTEEEIAIVEGEEN